MFAAMLAGIAFGNAGLHLPHAMSYAVSGLVEHYHAPQYPGDVPIVPHGMAVVLNAPGVFRYTASANPQRHLEAAEHLGADIRGAGPNDAGEVLAARITEFMKATKMPNGIGGVGYTSSDLDALADGAFPQKSLVNNAPRETSREQLRELFSAALRYW